MPSRRPETSRKTRKYYLRVQRQKAKPATNLSVWLIGAAAILAVIASIAAISKFGDSRPNNSTQAPAEDNPNAAGVPVDSSQAARAYENARELLRKARLESGGFDQAKLKEAAEAFDKALEYYRQLADKYPGNSAFSDRIRRINQMRYEINKSTVVR